MGDLYVRSTDGNDADNGSTWALAKATAAGASTIASAGDTINFSQLHAEASAAALTINFPGAISNPVNLLAVNDAAEPPTALASGAEIATTTFYVLTINGSVFNNGVKLTAGSATSGPVLNLNTGTTSAIQTHVDAAFKLGGSGSAARININYQSNTAGNYDTNLIRPDFFFSHAIQGLSVTNRLKISGGQINAGSAALTTAFFRSIGASGRAANVLVEGFDFSNLASNCSLVDAAAVYGGSKVVFDGIKVPASWTGGLITGTLNGPGSRIIARNIDNAGTNYRLWIEDYAGTIKEDTFYVKTGGSSDGVTQSSLKLTSINTGEKGVTLNTEDILFWNETVGSSITVSIDILHDSATALKDNELWLKAHFLGSASSPLTSQVSSQRANILTTATDVPASIETWVTTGMTNPNKQRMSVTFTPQLAGWVRLVVCLAKPSYTIYVDDKPVIE